MEHIYDTTTFINIGGESLRQTNRAGSVNKSHQDTQYSFKNISPWRFLLNNTFWMKKTIQSSNSKARIIFHKTTFVNSDDYFPSQSIIARGGACDGFLTAFQYYRHTACSRTNQRRLPHLITRTWIPPEHAILFLKYFSLTVSPK